MQTNNKSLTFINIVDPHFRIGIKPYPKSRKETFDEEIIYKVDQICEIAEENKVDFITITGDVLDIKNKRRYSIDSLRGIGDQLKKLKEATILEMLFTIAGNHDLPYSSRDYKYKSVYDYFCHIGLLNDIHKKSVRIDYRNGSLCLNGLDYNKSLKELYKEIGEINKSIEKQKRVKNFLLFHEHLLPREDFKKEKFLESKFSYQRVLKEFKNIDGFLCGHYHKGYKPYIENNRVIINDWNLTRLARNYYVLNDQHKPTISLIKVKGDSIKVESIELKCKPFNNTIALEGIEDDLKENIDTKEFINKVKEVTKTLKELGDESLTSGRLNKRQKKLLDEIIEELKD